MALEAVCEEWNNILCLLKPCPPFSVAPPEADLNISAVYYTALCRPRILTLFPHTNFIPVVNLNFIIFDYLLFVTYSKGIVRIAKFIMVPPCRPWLPGRLPGSRDPGTSTFLTDPKGL